MMHKITLATTILLLTATLAIAQNTGRKGFVVAGKVIPHSVVPNNSPDSRSIECDSLRYPAAWDQVYYLINPETGSGYITGNNSFNDRVKADYFSTYEAGTQITGMLADFAIAKNSSNPLITFAIWNNNGTNGKPGTMVASATKTLSSIVSDVTNGIASSVTFDQPFTVTGPYYAGIVLPVVTGDTLALWCRLSAEGYNGTAWEQWADNTWYPFNDPLSWGTDMQTTLTIHPVVCKTVGLNELTDPEASVHPNPAGGIVNISTWRSSEKINLEIFTMTGKQAYARAFPGSITNFNIDLSTLPKGMYMIRISDSKRRHSQKLVME